MKLEQYIDVIVKFMQDYLKDSHQDGYVLGLSGGIDSSAVAALALKAVGKERLHCIMMPINSLEDDLKDAITLAKDLDINYSVIDGSKAFNELVKEFESLGIELDASTKGNLKARIRMSILYAYGQKNRMLVLGTDNLDESYVGYFTKYGDGGVDLLPICRLTKEEVRNVASILGVRKELVERVPSAGLYEGQTDEKEMGILYKDLDAYLLGQKVDEEVVNKIERLHRISEHKRVPIPRPEEFKRD
ncbi:MAG: NAD(+) synthase [Erysipelotrichaceae bacterium]|nr:NAD(+) synthase [Erysipelotrichaceae bacterium]